MHDFSQWAYFLKTLSKYALKLLLLSWINLEFIDVLVNEQGQLSKINTGFLEVRLSAKRNQ